MSTTGELMAAAPRPLFCLCVESVQQQAESQGWPDFHGWPEMLIQQMLSYFLRMDRHDAAKGLLAHCSLSEVNFSETTEGSQICIDDEWLAALRGHSDLCILKCNDCSRVTDEGLMSIAASLHNMCTMCLNAVASVSSGAIQAMLCVMSELAELCIHCKQGVGIPLETSCIDAMKGLTHIRTLKLTNFSGFDSEQTEYCGLGKLAALPSLSTLDVSETDFNDGTLLSMAGIKGLTDLCIRGCTRISDAGRDALRQLDSLEVLNLARTMVSDLTVECLEGHNRLQELNLAGTKVTNASCNVLNRMPGLTAIDLSCKKITSEGLKRLGALRNVTSLNLAFSQVDDIGMQDLQHLPITSLSLRWTRISDTALMYIAGASPEDESLKDSAKSSEHTKSSASSKPPVSLRRSKSGTQTSTSSSSLGLSFEDRTSSSLALHKTRDRCLSRSGDYARELKRCRPFARLTPPVAAGGGDAAVPNSCRLLGREQLSMARDRCPLPPASALGTPQNAPPQGARRASGLPPTPPKSPPSTASLASVPPAPSCEQHADMSSGDNGDFSIPHNVLALIVPTTFVFIGRRVGALLDSLLGKGVTWVCCESYGSAALYKASLYGHTFIHTPGMVGVTETQEAADAVSAALRQGASANGATKVFFVVTQSNEQVDKREEAAMELILASAPITHHGMFAVAAREELRDGTTGCVKSAMGVTQLRTSTRHSHFLGTWLTCNGRCVEIAGMPSDVARFLKDTPGVVLSSQHVRDIVASDLDKMYEMPTTARADTQPFAESMSSGMPSADSSYMESQESSMSLTSEASQMLSADSGVQVAWNTSLEQEMGEFTGLLEGVVNGAFEEEPQYRTLVLGDDAVQHTLWDEEPLITRSMEFMGDVENLEASLQEPTLRCCEISGDTEFRDLSEGLDPLSSLNAVHRSLDLSGEDLSQDLSHDLSRELSGLGGLDDSGALGGLGGLGGSGALGGLGGLDDWGALGGLGGLGGSRDESQQAPAASTVSSLKERPGSLLAQARVAEQRSRTYDAGAFNGAYTRASHREEDASMSKKPAAYTVSAPMQRIETLDLSVTEVAGWGLSFLSQLPNLTSLNLFSTKVCDEGLRHIADASSLVDLNLCGTGITDAGAPHLLRLASLGTLKVSGNQGISDHGAVTLLGLAELLTLETRWYFTQP